MGRQAPTARAWEQQGLGEDEATVYNASSNCGMLALASSKDAKDAFHFQDAPMMILSERTARRDAAAVPVYIPIRPSPHDTATLLCNLVRGTQPSQTGKLAWHSSSCDVSVLLLQ